MPKLLKIFNYANAAINNSDDAARPLRPFITALNQLIIKTVIDSPAARAGLLFFRFPALIILGSLVGIIGYSGILHINKTHSRSSTTATSSETTGQAVATFTESAQGPR